MIIAGAGGHGQEVAMALDKMGFQSSQVFFYDQDKSKSFDPEISESLVLEEVDLINILKSDSRFVIGVGNPIHREKLFLYLSSLGGSIFGVSFVPGIETNTFDAMPYSFVGPKTKIGLGVLINTRAHVHHECEVGDFSEIGPGAMLLGASKIGYKCRIGAGAIILPSVELGNEVIVGAGAVVTKSYLEPCTLIGIPARIQKK
ncbi:DapH/DapD/GlmU-related protein [Algoriphagus sp.]|uniref:PglD-related sugar-binding protein n=1 Tax=Algoriphagus sp. TaxID=1872435 RepID=UPI0025CF2611|nr:DapH/DapD/GlmU-related protein [Algoriphagus sp.]